MIELPPYYDKYQTVKSYTYWHLFAINIKRIPYNIKLMYASAKRFLHSAWEFFVCLFLLITLPIGIFYFAYRSLKETKAQIADYESRYADLLKELKEKENATSRI